MNGLIFGSVEQAFPGKGPKEQRVELKERGRKALESAGKCEIVDPGRLLLI